MEFSYDHMFFKYGDDSYGKPYESNGYYEIISEILIVIDGPIFKYSFVNEKTLILIDPNKQSKIFTKIIK